MSRPQPRSGPDVTARHRRRINRGIWFSLGTILTAVITSTIAEVMANKLSELDVGFVAAVLDRSVLWGVAAAFALAALGGLIALRRSLPRQPQPEFPRLPPAANLVGRDDLVQRVVTAAEDTRAVVVCGPGGSGASAIAVNAARQLVPDGGRQLYVDLRGPDPDPRRPESRRRVMIRVLRALGVAQGFRDPDRAGEKISDVLRTGQRVLVLDNMSSLVQVSWVLRHISDGYVIAAGDVEEPADVPAGVAYLHVGPLGYKDALTLLCAQDPEGRPRGRIDRLRFWRRPNSRSAASVASRVAAEQSAADELAKRFLTNPRVVIQMGRWLAAKQHTTIGMLLHDLKRGTFPSELDFILRMQLKGASAGARKLLSLLAVAPVAELTEAAAAALAGAPVDRTARHLRALADRSLVDWTQPSRCRLLAEARHLADPVRPSPRGKALARLAAHFAGISETHAETFVPGRPRDRRTDAAMQWFQVEDVTLLQVLKMPDPPREAGPHLWRIADALDAWFWREQRIRDRRAAARAMATAAKSAGDRAAQAAAQLRLSALAAAAGEFEAAGEHLDQADRHHGRSDRWLPQYETGRAVWNLVVTGDSTAAENHLDRCRRARPRRDSAGRLIDLINLAALRIEEGNGDAAHDYLSQVLDLAEDVDPSAYAHARELMGVVAWRRGHKVQAREDWAAAANLYQDQKDNLGRARCLQHTAATMLDEPNRKPARKMLRDSLELRGGDTGLGVALVHLYLGADAALAGDRDGVARHRKAGLDALSPWDGRPTAPSQVAAARTRLQEL